MAVLSADSDERARSRARRLRAAVVSSVLSKVGSVAYLILAVPLIIASVGTDGYSQFAVVIAAFGWLGPVFVGLGSAVTERIAGDAVRPISERTRGTFMTSLSVTGLLLFVFFAGGALLLLTRPAGEPDHTALIIAGVATGLGVGGGLFDSALLGLQRLHVTNVLSFASSIVAVIATVAAAILAPTVGAMVLATLGPVVVARAISGYVLHREEPGLWGRVADIDWGAAPRIAGRGFVFALISFESFLLTDAGLLVVAGRLGTTEVAEVALFIRVLPLILSIVGMITVPLWPALAEASADGDVHWISKAGSRAAAFVMVYASVGCLIIVVAGRRVVELWTGGRIEMPFEILLAAGALIIVVSFEAIAQTILIGLGRASSVATVLMFRSILSIVLVAVLAGPLGEVAALIGPIGASLITSSWLLPLLVVRALRDKDRARQLVRAGPRSS